jgi:antitoxin PrlF
MLSRIDEVMQSHYHLGIKPDTQEADMSATLEVESTLTDRYQTTVPETVRRALKLGKRDKIHYTIRASGEVVLTRVETSGEEDSLIAQFLGFLASDLASNPARLQTLDATFVQRIRSLVSDVEIDLDVALSADDE